MVEVFTPMFLTVRLEQCMKRNLKSPQIAWMSKKPNQLQFVTFCVQLIDLINFYKALGFSVNVLWLSIKPYFWLCFRHQAYPPLPGLKFLASSNENSFIDRVFKLKDLVDLGVWSCPPSAEDHLWSCRQDRSSPLTDHLHLPLQPAVSTLEETSRNAKENLPRMAYYTMSRFKGFFCKQMLQRLSLSTLSVRHRRSTHSLLSIRWQIGSPHDPVFQ